MKSTGITIIIVMMMVVLHFNSIFVNEVQSLKISMDNNLSTADATFLRVEGEDWLGDSVSIVGDVNGDGYDDILMSSWLNDENGKDSGQTYLFLGKKTGWKMPTQLSNADASFLGEEEYDKSGKAIAGAGDVNGDGYDDILIGALANGRYNESYGGKTYLIFGKPTGWKTDTSLSNADVGFLGAKAYDSSGSSVAGAGDVNGDGYDDILIGAIHSDDDGRNFVGRTYLVFGRSDGWKSNISLSETDASFLGEKKEAYSGYSVAGVGDVNGDGYDDILISARNFNNSEPDEGKIFLIFGKSSGWGKDFPLSQADATFLSEEIGDGAGFLVSGVGDVNGDGYHDFMIGAVDYKSLGNYTGKAYLIFGKPSGWKRDVNLSDADASFVGERGSGFCGGGLAGSGDINDDGYDDLLIGCPADVENGIGSGQTYIILGKSSGWTRNTNLSNSDASFLGENEGDWSGSSVSNAGDVNGDGFDDVLIGAARNSEGGHESGKVYCIFGSNHNQTSGHSHTDNTWTVYLLLIVIFILAVILLIRGVKKSD